MEKQCKIKECAAPVGDCHESGGSCENCCHWLESNAANEEEGKVVPKKIIKSNLSWSGEPLKVDELPVVTSRNSPICIGIVGKVDAGKTTFLAMLYTLLFNGRKLEAYNFSGTFTIKGWDELYSKLKIQKEKVTFPDPTPTEYIRLLHLALRDKNNSLKDLLISEASGEVYTYWSQNRNDELAQNARWVYKNAEGFILFVDCDDLLNHKNRAKTEIIDIAQQLKHDLQSRPVVIAWSKSDTLSKVNPQIIASLKSEFKNLFSNYTEIEISNFSKGEPDEMVHTNNLKVIDWLIEKLVIPSNEELSISSNYKNDFFLNYKGT